MADAVTIPSAGEMLEDAVASSDVGVYVGRDEPAEFSYDYAKADRRALNVLKRVATAENVELDPDLESAPPVPGIEQANVRADSERASSGGLRGFLARRRSSSE